MKKLILAGSLAVSLIMVPFAVYALNNCCAMTATTIGCEGNTTTWMICHWLPFPEDAMCDGSSPGSPYPDGEYASPNGTDDMAVRLASCWATATATGNCCDGAITTWQVTGIYDYSKCVGNQCPGG